MTRRALGSPIQVLRLLERSWSRETSSRWTPESASRGQCGVTALVIQDYFGGEILKTRVGSAWHFYNRVDGGRLDLTAGQFPQPFAYEDLVSSREEALADTSEAQYAALARAFREAWEGAGRG